MAFKSKQHIDLGYADVDKYGKTEFSKGEVVPKEFADKHPSAVFVDADTAEAVVKEIKKPNTKTKKKK